MRKVYINKFLFWRMKIFAEKEAEVFLKGEGFDIIDTVFIKEKSELSGAVEQIGFPLVMKVSGQKILHKNRIGGVNTKIENIEQAEKTFDYLMKLQDAEGVILQKQISGDEFILGLKATIEFGHVLAFGIGGTDVEKIKKVAFRVCPLNETEANDLIREINENIDGEELNGIKKNILQLCKLSKKYSNITELDINPLMVEKDKAVVVDARMVWE
jgi:succinyl-CoA synthetase beta subunit